jgi:hypothetical protein
MVAHRADCCTTVGKESKKHMKCQPPIGRVYHMTWLRQFLAVFVSAFGVSLVTGIWIVPLFRASDFEGREASFTIAFIFLILFLLVGVGGAIFAFRSTITFTDDAIVVRNLFGEKRMLVSEIRGRREYVSSSSEGGGTRYLKLVAHDYNLPAIEFEKSYAFDADFWRWFNSLYNLDADENPGSKDAKFGLV